MRDRSSAKNWALMCKLENRPHQEYLFAVGEPKATRWVVRQSEMGGCLCSCTSECLRWLLSPGPLFEGFLFPASGAANVQLLEKGCSQRTPCSLEAGAGTPSSNSHPSALLFASWRFSSEPCNRSHAGTTRRISTNDSLVLRKPAQRFINAS